jgi:predicted chitinase
MDAETLAAAMGRSLSTTRYAALCPAFNAAMLAAGCTTVNRAAMWCAQLGEESGGLRWMEEIASGAAYEGRGDLGNVYPGDGTRYKGRGPLQITGRAHYGELSRWAHSCGYVPSDTYFVDAPSLLSSDKYGFLGAVWYWTVARPRLNAYADAGDVLAATKAINGGTNGLADRQSRWDSCLRLGGALLPTADATAPDGRRRHQQSLLL